MQFIIIPLLMALLLLTSPAFSADSSWRIFDVKGKVSLQNDSGTRALSNGKNLFEMVQKGSRFKVGSGGKVVIVSLKSRQAFEIGENSEGIVEADHVRAIKGAVSLKKSFALPKTNDGSMGGVVMRSGGNISSCLKPLSPSNTAVIDHSPELSWENSCDGLKQVTVTVLADERIVLTAESNETHFKIPDGLVQPGRKYMWLIAGGSDFDMASGVFTILPEADRKEVLEKTAAYAKVDDDDIAEMIAYLYFIAGKGLNEMARLESNKIRQRFPSAAGLKDLP